MVRGLYVGVEWAADDTPVELLDGVAVLPGRNADRQVVASVGF